MSHKKTGELKLFKKIWIERGRFSEVNGEPISSPAPWNFAHILSKAENRYPHFKLLEDNIMIMTRHQHYQWDNEREKIRHDPMWQHVFKKEAELLKRYSDEAPQK